MSWDDDDFDVEEDIKAQQKEADESEMTIDDIEEARRKKAEAEAAAAPKQKKKPKVKEEEVRPEDCAYDVALEDPVAEKMRRQKLVEEADARMAADLFSGVDKASDEEERVAARKAEEEAERQAKEAEAAKKKAVKVQIEVHDAFDKLQLATQADVESLLGTCMEKMEDAKVKEAAKLFLTQILKALVDDLSTEELNNLDKQITGIVKGKKVEQTSKAAGATKSGAVKTKTDKNGNVKEVFNKNASYDIAKETADVYGGWGDDWDEEDWADDGTAAQYAPPKK